MAFNLLTNGVKLQAAADNYRTVDGGFILRGREVLLDLPTPAVRVYVHGWQSWGLTTWLPAGRPLPIPFPKAVNPLRVDLALAGRPNVTSSWVGAVKFSDEKILLLGALGLDAHVEYLEGTMRGWYDQAQGEWFVAYGKEVEVFDQYATELSKIFGRARDTSPPRVWCSWNSLYTHIEEDGLSRILQELQGFAFDVFQVDDGWQQSIGDWEPNAKFPSGMQALADSIRAQGFIPGIWASPFIASKTSRLFKNHPDWFLRDEQGQLVSAGNNLGNQLFALDVSLPDVLDWLAALMKKIRGWGYDYLKLDFLYAGALPGKRSSGISRENSLRSALKVMRDNLENAYLLVCGVPILPALGLCDGIRIGPDTGPEWYNRLFGETLYDFGMPGGQNSIRTCLHRLWLKPLAHLDPDSVHFRSIHLDWTPEQREFAQLLAMICGIRGTSDLPRWLDPRERDQLADFLRTEPVVIRQDRYRFMVDGRMVDFSPVVDLPPLSAMKTGPIKRAIQHLSSSAAILRLLGMYEEYLRKRRLQS